MAGRHHHVGVDGALEQIRCGQVSFHEGIEGPGHVPGSIVARQCRVVERLVRIAGRSFAEVRYRGDDDPMTRESRTHMDVVIGWGSPSRREHHERKRPISDGLWLLVGLVQRGARIAVVTDQ